MLPPAPEACSVGLAPTTSTTMTLALGDALAVALMEHRALHAGRISRASIPAAGSARGWRRWVELMHGGEEMPLIGPDAGMAEALLR